MGVTGLDVDSRGNVYVADRSDQLLVFSPGGTVLRKLGRKGQGPGEFDGLYDVHLLPGDSIYAFDAGLVRVTVFPPRSDRAAYSLNVGTNAMLFPYWVRPVASGRSIFAAYRAAFGDRDGRGLHGHRKEVLRILNPDGSILRDSVIVFAEAEALFLHGQVEGVTFNPFGRQPVFALGRGDRVYAAWNGELAIGVYSASGRRIKTIRPAIAARPRPITEADRDSVVADLASTVPAAEVRRAFAEIGSDSWPLFRDMVVDDADRVWLGLLGRHGEPVHWTAFDQAGAPVASMDLPENVSLRVLRGRMAYGVELDEDDVPRVVIYELRPLRPAPARGA
ncbi:MAG TPA: hypothetical protein VGO40_21910 [Longimicrobium sp.]|nr:hypothetical protein [Longimicrobium sp.]